MAEHGDDSSHWNGRVDWDEARTQIRFDMAKATQGTDYVDEQYERSLTDLRRLGVNLGSYHYPDIGDAQAQAAYYVDNAHRRNGEMQALDFEGAILGVSDPVGWAHAWLSEVFALTDNVPLIYMSGSVVTEHDWTRVVKLGAGLWVASWGSQRPTGAQLGAWPFAIMWQRDDDGNLRGADGQVDQDVFYGDADTWAHYAHNRGTAPDPVPRPRPRPRPGRREYVVVDGDTLSSIAQRFYSDVSRETLDRLVHANEVRHPSLAFDRDYIRPGWRLNIPEVKK